MTRVVAVYLGGLTNYYAWVCFYMVYALLVTHEQVTNFRWLRIDRKWVKDNAFLIVYAGVSLVVKPRVVIPISRVQFSYACPEWRMISSVVEHRLDMAKVSGSNPLSSTKFAALADVVIALVWRTSEPGSIPGGSTIVTEVWQSPVYCYSLENCRSERVREFESHRFHQQQLQLLP